jgi:tetratricopeptide (TPR) repeat protein
MLNGRLKQVEGPLEKGRKLLEEAIGADSSHEEARLYMAFLHAHEGKVLQAQREYRHVFRTAMSDVNRGHAAVQLGRLHEAEGNYRKALACFRWLNVSGLAQREERFFFVQFNLGLEYALVRDRARSLAAFRRLVDDYPQRLAETQQLFLESNSLQEAIESEPGFIEELVAACPALFGGGPDQNHASGELQP